METQLNIDRCMSRLLGDVPIEGNYQLAHIHIPKTAGVAVQSVLKDYFAPFTHLPWNDGASHWRSLTEGKGFDGQMVTGHIRFGDLKYDGFIETRPIYCTAVIREPLKRVVSLYNYNRSVKHPRHERFAQKFPTLNEFVISFAKTRNTGNRQCNWLTGNRANPNEISQILNQNYIGITTQEFTDWYLSKLISTLLGKNAAIQAPVMNELGEIKHGSRNGIEDIDPDIKLQFYENNRLDAELYQTLSAYIQGLNPELYVTQRASGQSKLSRIRKKVSRAMFSQLPRG